ncbi:uncharacterized protein [Leuresthes tenuis]|uniref:uncharacterized protein n=1 Tax=Leuresthes tenuis TaxID=355514 RepID=UPI003B5093B0
MDVADELIDKIFSLVDLQKRCAKKLDNVADELEDIKKGCNVAKVVGSSVSVGGAVALTAAGILGAVTAGAAIPVLAATGAIASGAGLVTNVVSDVTDLIASSCNMKEAKETADKIENLEKGVQKLMETLKKEGEKREKLVRSRISSSEDYVVEMILKAMAKREGLTLNDGVSLSLMLSVLSTTMSKEKRQDFALLGLSLVYKVAMIAVRKSGKNLASNGFPELARAVGRKAAGRAVGRIGAGAVGLIFSIPELIINCERLGDCQTEASKTLRENAEAMRTASREMEADLKKTQAMFRRLAKVLRSIENTERRSRDERKTLIEFAKENCKDEAVKQWLAENEESKTFFRLVDMFHFLKGKIDEEEKNNHTNTVDVTFVAHGAIIDSMIPASCLLPLSSISDIILYSPWNCVITADAAYGVATGRIRPQHREFLCSSKRCKVAGKEHRPSKLPKEWNSMKKAGNQKVPNINLSPLKVPEDGAWNRFEVLKDEHGEPGRNRIVIPFILPEGSSDQGESVPLSMVTLALSLVLMFSRFQVTLHLTACLGKESKRMKLDEDALKKQYAYTINNTAMTTSEEMLPSRFDRIVKFLFGWLSYFSSPEDRLYRGFKSLFG